MKISLEKPDHVYWDIVKGIGILCVVIGHSWMRMQNFVYSFHMPLFFFVAGYLYDERKYGDRPYVYISRRIRSIWIKYVMWEIVFILFHNIFYNMGMLYGIGIDSHIYSKTEILSEVSKAVLGCANELLIGALWFAPVLVISVSGLGLIIAVSRKLEYRTGSFGAKIALQLFFVTIAGTVGYILIDHQKTLSASMQIAMSVLPYIWVGYILRNYIGDIRKYLNGVVAFVMLLLVFFVSRKYLISLANGFVYPFMYILAFLGIYDCLYLARLLEKKEIFAKGFSLLGEASFLVMTLHLFIFRLIDRLYSVKYGKDWVSYYMKLPAAFDELVPVYLIFGIGIPVMIWYVYKKGVQVYMAFFHARLMDIEKGKK